ncbi:OB-fold domain-containing protein, partial [Treponema saccharophilum]
MFNSLAGTVTGKFPQRLLLDTHGIEWDIIVPDTSLDKIPPVGESARVFVWMQHTDS